MGTAHQRPGADNLTRDVLQFADVSETTEDLSNLADAILNATGQAVRREPQQEGQVMA